MKAYERRNKSVTQSVVSGHRAHIKRRGKITGWASGGESVMEIFMLTE